MSIIQIYKFFEFRTLRFQNVTLGLLLKTENIYLTYILNKGLLHILNNYEKEIRHQKRNNKSR